MTDQTDKPPELPKPNPGSPEAVALGCKCARLDNAHGHGYMGIPGVFCVNGTCPLHGTMLHRDDAP